MIMRAYTIPGCMYWDDVPPTPPQYVCIFVCDPYKEQNKLHPYHKRRRIWATCDKFGAGFRTGSKRTRQIERWCKLSGFKCEITR